jgi:hypothetical protein
MTYKLFSKRNGAITKRCPYCGGSAKITSHLLWDYDCLRCDRAWKVFGDTWTALFDAANTIFVKNQHKAGR